MNAPFNILTYFDNLTGFTLNISTSSISPHALRKREQTVAEYEMLQHGLEYGLSLGMSFIEQFPDGVDDPQSCIDFKDECVARMVTFFEDGLVKAGIPPARYCATWRASAEIGFSNAIRTHAASLH